MDLSIKDVGGGCLTVMTVTLVLTDSTHFTLAITGTDGRCDLLTTYNEATIWVRQQPIFSPVT